MYDKLTDPRETPALRRILDAGASISGATTGAAVGAAVAGPPGAIAGASVGWAVQTVMNVGGDFALRHLAPLGEKRVGAAILMAADEISARIMAGETPREDLRDDVTPGRSAAAELAEAALRAAAGTHEERKLPYIAHLLAAIAFERELSHAHANQLIGVADALTYRQLVALAVYEEIKGPGGPDFWGEASWAREESSDMLSLRADLLDLFRRGFVRVRQREQRVRKEKPYRPDIQRRGISSTDPQHEYVTEPLPWPAIPMEVNAREIRLSTEGERLTRMMRLREIPTADRASLVLKHLRIRRDR